MTLAAKHTSTARRIQLAQNQNLQSGSRQHTRFKTFVVCRLIDNLPGTSMTKATCHESSTEESRYLRTGGKFSNPVENSHSKLDLPTMQQI